MRNTSRTLRPWFGRPTTRISSPAATEPSERIRRYAPGRNASVKRYVPERICESFPRVRDRKSTRLNSSHITISYAVFCLKKKKYRVVQDLFSYNFRFQSLAHLTYLALVLRAKDGVDARKLNDVLACVCIIRPIAGGLTNS